ncbi:MAG TPA: response regulator [Gemmatimonadales bacterium]|nr:response regulator [Gemmatimonadales bacterium]
MVDDDEDMVRLMRAILAQHGFTDVDQVSLGADALARGGEFDVVLLDHQLPDMSGVEAVGPLRARPKPPSIVVVTGNGTEALAAAVLRRGADDYLVKDASLAHLLPQVLDRVRRERALRVALSTAQQELVRAERLAAIGEMTVTLHHEINNPLMTATAELDLLSMSGDPVTPAQRSALDALRESLDRIRDIVRRIGSLRQARTTPYPGNLRMIDLAEDGSGAGIELPLRSRGTAVLHVADDPLAQVVTGVLQKVGYEVQRCRAVETFAKSAHAVGVTLAVVADEALHVLPERGEFFQTVALVSDDDAAHRVSADLVVRLPFDPYTLAEELLSLSDENDSAGL